MTERSPHIPARTGNPFRFTFREASGALGDMGTLLPLTIAVIAVAGLSSQQVLLGFGLFYVVTGLVYRLPVPVQPMKAIAAVALVSQVTPASIALSGVLVGLALLLLGGTGIINRIARLVPGSVLAGIQLGLGLGLGWMALGLIGSTWFVGVASLCLAVTALRLGAPAALITIFSGILIGALSGVAGLPAASPDAPSGWPLADLDFAQLRVAVSDLAAPQLALTLTNAVFLTCLVAQDCFGERASHITPRKLCLTTGLANVVLAPFGAMPMCHGAGGVAAHSRFGARSGAAPVMLGAALLVIAFLPGEIRNAVLSAIPAATLGALLLIAAVELGMSRRVFDAKPSCLPVIAITALVTVFVDPLSGLIAGTVAEVIRKLLVARWQVAKN